MRTGIVAVLGCLCLLGPAQAGEEKKPTPLEQALASTEPLKAELGSRMPLVLWTPDFPDTTDEAALRKALEALKARGIALLHRWPGDVKKGLETATRVGRLQKELGMPVCVDGTGPTQGFRVKGHVDKDGKEFNDSSFFWRPGCPFAYPDRYEVLRKIFADYVEGYKAAGLAIDCWMDDFECDSPIEWKDGWKAAKKCVRCREKIPHIDTDFKAFQDAVRKIRTELQRVCWVEPIVKAFPKVRIGNYAMTPTDGWRYYWDFYEEQAPGKPMIVDGAEYKREQNAFYRRWPDEFKDSGYTIAMPVAYTWYNIYTAYTFPNKQYRWFYGMLLEVTGACKAAGSTVPVIPFVHWSPTVAPSPLPAGEEALSEANYEEFLWHCLLRGADSFAMWCMGEETALEAKPVHKVFAEALAFREFLDQGEPVLFDVPAEAGTVVSGLRLKDRLLVRRTDFNGSDKPVTVQVGGKAVEVRASPGKCAEVKLP